jgi:hypothetical protein
MLDNRDYPKVAKELDRQGWRMKETKKADFWMSPDGVHSASWHHTPSDHRALANFVSKCRQGGFVWPPKKGR